VLLLHVIGKAKSGQNLGNFLASLGYKETNEKGGGVHKPELKPGLCFPIPQSL
jgi:hypothetical protein